MREHRNGNGPAANGSIRPHHETCLILTAAEAGATLRLRLTGEFDLAGVGAVESALDRLDQAPGLGRGVFDLRDLRFLGVAGPREVFPGGPRGGGAAVEGGG